jgi:hypothetical protein
VTDIIYLAEEPLLCKLALTAEWIVYGYRGAAVIFLFVSDVCTAKMPSCQEVFFTERQKIRFP